MQPTQQLTGFWNKAFDRESNEIEKKKIMKDDEGFADDITTLRSFKRRHMEIHEAHEAVKCHLIPCECP